MTYEQVDNIEEATHWVGLYDPKFEPEERIILYKPYILFESSDGETAIIDELGDDINLWLCHKGYFVKEVVE